MENELVKTLTVSEAVRIRRENSQEFRHTAHRLTGTLVVHGYGACLYDAENTDDCVHIPGAWIYNSMPADLSQRFGMIQQYCEPGAVTGFLELGGLCAASLTMFRITSFECEESAAPRIVYGPFRDTREVELLDRAAGPNAVIRWPGKNQPPMVTLDLGTIHSINQQIERIGIPEYEQHDGRGTPLERVTSRFRGYYKRINRALEALGLNDAG